MQKLFRLLCSALALTIVSAGAVQAQEYVCKDKAVTATSRLYISKSVGAYPGSWAAWRKATKAKHGNGWQAWRRSKEQSIECEKVKNDAGKNRWQCTRTAVPCKPKGNVVAKICDGPPITSNLRRGDSGEQVKTLQCLLKKYHGAKLTVDGDFGKSTRKAVRDFQKKYKLTVDGVVGDKTLEKILS